MERLLYTYQSVGGDYPTLQSLLSHRLRQLMQAGTGSPPTEPAGDGSFQVRLSGRVGRMTVGHSVRVHVGQAEHLHDPPRLRLPLDWRAETVARAFPSFRGRLQLERLSDRQAQLALLGDYTVPLGALGALGDATALYGLAERTARHLLDGLVGELVSAELAEVVAPRDPATPLRVADVMTRDPVTMTEDMPLRAGAALLLHCGISGAPVLDDGGRLVGVLSESDLLHKEAFPRGGLGRAAAAARRRRAARTVGQACSRPARTTTADVSLHAAAREMAEHDLGRLVVFDGHDIAGVISRRDVLRALDRDDADLRAAVHALLDELAEPDVGATVQWGELLLSGLATRHSRVALLAERAELIDGVVGVDVDLDWVDDDLVPPRAPVPFS